MQELRPDCLEDLIAGVSLYRPGPMDQIPRYVRGKLNPGHNTVYKMQLTAENLQLTEIGLISGGFCCIISLYQRNKQKQSNIFNLKGN